MSLIFPRCTMTSVSKATQGPPTSPTRTGVMPMSRVRRAASAFLASSAVFAAALMAVPSTAYAQAEDESPGVAALDTFRNPSRDRPVLTNRFFTKTERFEVTPYFGYVPNNPFATRYIGGLQVGYHFNEQFSALGQVYYSPDLGEGDLKGLTRALVQIARTGPNSSNFQQPLDKVTLAASFAASWAPIYGKINLLGETVVSFDLYGIAGLGMISKVDYFATFDEAGVGNDFVALQDNGNEVKLTPTIGLGTNFFVNRLMAIKLDGRFNFYIDNQPQYDPEVPVNEQRLYNVFVASVGVSFFFPTVQRRVFDF